MLQTSYLWWVVGSDTPISPCTWPNFLEIYLSAASHHVYCTRWCLVDVTLALVTLVTTPWSSIRTSKNDQHVNGTRLTDP